MYPSPGTNGNRDRTGSALQIRKCRARSPHRNIGEAGRLLQCQCGLSSLPHRQSTSQQINKRTAADTAVHFMFWGPFTPFLPCSFPASAPGNMTFGTRAGPFFFLDFPRKTGTFSGICFVISSAFRNFVFCPGKLLKKYEAPADKLVQIYKSTSSP